ncbi:hypothetical protein L1857_00150 [Amycolatopsis thermalba]|uniref:Uncharacterized protein n=1 Tax=Amycolatopsis thermalba TaxID=944492 RepID=A0ABY4NPF1_9PSEU|nr:MULTISPECIES: hypothetical protein [Amycolatopsis]UQS21353.1 hypothetical protein L1857_00150 [Amycolatopsis thermalba]
MPSEADSFVTILEPALNGGKPILRFVNTPERDAAAIVAFWCKTGYVHVRYWHDGTGTVINFGLVTWAQTSQGSKFRGVGLPTTATAVTLSAADIAAAHAALARQGDRT